MMKKKWITLVAVLAVLAGLALWLKPRDCSCQRCGAGIQRCGPVIVGTSSHYLSGAGGDRGLYCKRNGHAIVKKYDPDKKVTDWVYHRDSYETEEEYQLETESRKQRE
jgi:hypothetical protein